MWKSGAGQYFKYGSVENPNSIDPSSLMIVDEADLSLNSLVSFDRATNHLNGLYWLKAAQKAIYMSATMPEYFKGVIKQTLG